MDEETAHTLLQEAEALGPALRGLDSKAAFQQLDAQYGEFQSALSWFIHSGHADGAFRLASALTAFWMATRRIDEGSAWLDRVLALPAGDDAHRGRALFDAGYLAFWRGQDEQSTLLQRAALDVGRRANNPTVAALALVGLARLALRAEDVEEARRLCREALAITEGTSDRLGRSSAMHVLAVAAQMSGDLVEARELMTRRIAIAREQGNTSVISSEAGNLSMVERQLGNLDQAEALAAEALDLDDRRGDDMALAWKVNGLAAVAKDRREFERAAALIGIADAALRAAGGAWPPDEWRHYEATTSALKAAMGEDAFERTRATGSAMAKSAAVQFALRRDRKEDP